MWDQDTYRYSAKVLKAIAEAYWGLYDGLLFREGDEITDPISLAEYKADFDIGLRGIGRGKWDGRLKQDYRKYDKLQWVVISDILGIGDEELTRLGFYDISRLRSYAYHLMCKYLNGEYNGVQNKDQ